MFREEESHMAPKSKDEDGVWIVRSCLWCNMNFHSMDNFSIHGATVQLRAAIPRIQARVNRGR
jgi:hypothetical protein